LVPYRLLVPEEQLEQELLGLLELPGRLEPAYLVQSL
jgi:hypothetical protein